MGIGNITRNIIFDLGFILSRQNNLEIIKNRILKFKIDSTKQNKFIYDRLGSNHDGGYVVPIDFEGIGLCLSAGVENRIDFEKDLYEKTGISSDLIDGSMKQFLDLPSFANFTSINLGPTTFENSISLNDWIKKNDKYDEFIFQCDIEGHEYSAILSTDEEYISRLRIIVLEIHFFSDIFSANPVNHIDELMTKLLRTHSLLHVHCNNCSRPFYTKHINATDSLELTFISNDRLKFNKTNLSSNPKDYDKPNNPNSKDFEFKIKF